MSPRLRTAPTLNRTFNCRLQTADCIGVSSRAEKYMRRTSVLTILALAATWLLAPVHAQNEGYRLVPNWPTLPPGDFFGLKTPPLPPAEREAAAAARRATGGGGNMPRPAGQGPTNQPGISGLAIDQNDRIYVFNRGAKPAMVLTTD